jgi:peptidyl-prolyl cis-trans isomerase B (cyclophilin B)
MTEIATEQTRASISVKVKGEPLGDITLRFFPEVAPNHVKNFVTLAKQKFYDGSTFHRVIPGFMIQGGDPNSKTPDRATHGMGGPGYRVKAEFNSKPHKRGALSMARSNDPDSAGSQFFICVADSNFLDWQYTVFGEVLSGMELADKIVAMKRDGRDNPLERVEMTVTIID